LHNIYKHLAAYLIIHRETVKCLLQNYYKLTFIQMANDWLLSFIADWLSLGNLAVYWLMVRKTFPDEIKQV